MSNKIEMKTDTVLIGAGLTGLTSAYHLHKRNKKFIVLEKENQVGGVIKTTIENGFLFEEGPNTGVIGNTAVVELFEDLATSCQLEIPGKTVNKRFILKNGRWEHLPMGFMDAVKTPLFSLKDKFRVLGEPFRNRGKDPHETLSSFVKRRLGNSFLEYAIDPFIKGVYAGDPHYLIPKYALPKLYNLEQNYGSLIGGSIKKSFVKKSELEKKVSRKVFSFEGGMGSLIQALYQTSGKENFVLGAQHIKVTPFENQFIVSYIDSKGEEVEISTPQVITTVGAYALENMLPFVAKTDMDAITSLLYTKVIELAIGFNRWEGISLDGFGGLIPSKEKRDLLGVLYMSSLFTDRNPKEGALFSVFIGGVSRQDLISKSDSEIEAIVEKECKSLLGLNTFRPDLLKIIRHQKAIPQYGVESGKRFETVKNIESQYPGLIIGGNLKDGIGMADRIQQGKEMVLKLNA